MTILNKQANKTYYNPHALQSNSSFADLLQSGVDVVLQLLQTGAFPSEGELLIATDLLLGDEDGEMTDVGEEDADEEDAPKSHGGGGEGAREGGNDLDCF